MVKPRPVFYAVLGNMNLYNNNNNKAMESAPQITDALQLHITRIAFSMFILLKYVFIFQCEYCNACHPNCPFFLEELKPRLP